MTTATLSPKSAKVKFRLAGGAQPLILLPVRVNERGPFEFILDTGAGTSLVSSELARELELKILGSKEGQSRRRKSCRFARARRFDCHRRNQIRVFRCWHGRS